MTNITLSEMKEIYSNKEAALFDLGDGIACIEFRSKGNSISPYVKEFIVDVIDNKLENFDGLVIGNQSKNFSVGADLFSMKSNIENKDFDAFSKKVESFQEMTSKIKYCNKPIVAAPYKMTLGGGLEVSLHCNSRVALNKSYLGLVEVGVGLIPGGGGTKESAILIGNTVKEEQDKVLFEVFEKLVSRCVSKDGADALRLGYLQEDDIIVEKPEELIVTAKNRCLDMVKNGFKPKKEQTVILPGKVAYDKLISYGKELLSNGKITQYDFEIGTVIAKVLAGSTEENNVEITEAQLLKLERDAFVYLTQQDKTYERISHFVDKGELLRN